MDISSRAFPRVFNEFCDFSCFLFWILYFSRSVVGPISRY